VTKRELVIEITERLGCTQSEVAGVVQAMLDAIAEALAKGERLEIRNFGVFEHRVRQARMGRNPRTGEQVPISQKRVATFRPGKGLKHVMEGGRFETEPAGE
jgi:nucleoid DNA-binding protein